MNFYEHRIRDYDAATAHLTWDEDMAYTRLIRWYYRKELPIPADINEACRQVRATSKVQRAAVESVLREFFVLQEDGWHKDSCDELIAEYQAREPEREAKRKNEDTRLRRHRDERARLFGVINAAGQHLPYNAPIAEVRALAARIEGREETPNATQPATAPATPATATQIPDPSSQFPLPTSQTPEGGSVVGAAAATASPPAGAAAPPTPAQRGTRLPKDWALPKAWGDWAIAEHPHWRPDTVRRIAEGFRDHWVAKPGKDGTKLDWQATWRTWCRSDITQRQYPPPRAGSPATPATATRNAEAMRLLGIAPPPPTGPEVIDA